MVCVFNLSLLAPAVLLLLSAVQGKPLTTRRADGDESASGNEDELKVSAPAGGSSTDSAGQYPLCGGRYPGCENNQPKKQKAPEGKRKLAYFPFYEGPLVPGGNVTESFNEQYLDGLTHLILFGVDATKLNDKGEIDYSPAYVRDFPKDIVKQARAKGAAVMAAIGGWDLDTLFKQMATKQDAQRMGSHIAKFAIANSLDGIDIDHEYPTAKQVDFWPALLEQIKKDAPGLILSIAVPGEPHWSENGESAKVDQTKASKGEQENVKRYVYEGPVYQHAFEGWTSLIKKVEPMVDFFNVMSYDMINGFSYGKGAYHHASHAGTVRTVHKYMKDLKVDPKKLNTGFAFYARYFPMSECSGGNQLDCALDSTFPEQSASSMRFDKLKNAEPNKCDQDSGLGPWDTKECGDAAQKEQKRTALGRFRTANKSFEKNVLPMQGTSKSKTYDDIAMADSLYDKESKLFWTWQSPYAITQTCEAIKKDTTIPIGGQFVYAIGQDSADLVHMKAFQDCVKEWK